MKNIFFALLAGITISTSYISTASADCDDTQMDEVDFSGYEHEDDDE